MYENSTRQISPQLIAWACFAAVAGVCSLALPPYLAKDGLPQPAYGWPFIPWFAVAWANQRATESAICFLVLGFTLGIVQPRRWLSLVNLAIVSPAVLNAINILHDWTRDATSHNLFPFEFLLYAFTCSPAVIGAFLGVLYHRRLNKEHSAKSAHQGDRDHVHPGITIEDMEKETKRHQDHVDHQSRGQHG